jgi:hypothetical protein
MSITSTTCTHPSWPFRCYLLLLTHTATTINNNTNTTTTTTTTRHYLSHLVRWPSLYCSTSPYIALNYGYSCWCAAVAVSTLYCMYCLYCLYCLVPPSRSLAPVNVFFSGGILGRCSYYDTYEKEWLSYVLYVCDLRSHLCDLRSHLKNHWHRWVTLNTVTA